MTGQIIREMILFFGKDIKRIAHALKVYAYAETLTELEEVGAEEREITVVAAIAAVPIEALPTKDWDNITIPIAVGCAVHFLA
jgi:dolichol kinase